MINACSCLSQVQETHLLKLKHLVHIKKSWASLEAFVKGVERYHGSSNEARHRGFQSLPGLLTAY